MGLIIPKQTGTPPPERDVAQAAVKLVDSVEPGDSAAKPRVGGGPNANTLNSADFPSRELPLVSGVREARFQVVFRQSVLDQIHAHGKTSMEAEVCGVLVGDIYADRMAPWAYVEHCIRGNNAVGKQTQVTITSETWSRIHETLEKDFPGKKIVGWYHTHPGFGIFLSGMDLFIQENFFNQPWQVATVYDPHSGDEGTFVWRAGKSNREPSLIENDPIVAPSTPAASNEAIEELTRRVRALERRLDVILTGGLCLVLLALVAPLILFAVRPDVFNKLPISRHPAPAATQPMPHAAPEAEKPGFAPLAPPAPMPSTQRSAAAPAPRPAAELVRTGGTDDGAPAGGPLILYPKNAGH